MKIYAIEVTRILQEEFFIKADSAEEAEKYGLCELAYEVDEEVESTSKVSMDFEDIDEIPMLNPDVIDITKKD